MLLTATMLFLSGFIVFTQPGIASSLSETINQVDGEENTSDNITIQNKNLWETYLNAVFEITGAVSNYFYYAPAKRAEIPGAYGATTGTIAYTNNNPFAETTVNFKDYYDSIYAFGKVAPGNFNKKIGIAIYRASNWTRVAGNNVYSGEGVTAGRMSSGEYKIIYNIHDPIKWDLGVFYFINTPPCTQCIPLEEPQPYAIEDKQNNALLENYSYNNTVFTIPQQEAFKNNNTKSKPKKSVLTINDLLNDMFDEELQEYVHSLKSFNTGDSIIVSDTITDIYYDSDNQTTSFGFDYLDKMDSEISKVYWEFVGDLRNQFSIGDSVSFKTEVVYIDRDLNLESLDILGFTTNVTPNIDSYLLSHLKKNEDKTVLSNH